MKYDPERHHRRSIRLPGYDYTRPGVYFVTLVTHERQCLFGDIVGVGATCRVALNLWGEIARAEWFQTAVVRPYVVLHEDEFVVMPNHVHGIIWIMDDAHRGAAANDEWNNNRGDDATNDEWNNNRGGADRRGAAPLRPYHETPPINVIPGSLGAIVRAYKSAVTKHINTLRGTPGVLTWQRNYYEHIIRDEQELQRIRQYILDNPALWAEDRENPDVVAIRQGRR
ncbi:MAG: transposase [Anaerolineae bacterium]